MSSHWDEGSGEKGSWSSFPRSSILECGWGKILASQDLKDLALAIGGTQGHHMDHRTA